MKKKTNKNSKEQRVDLQDRDFEAMRTLATYGMLRLSTLHALCYSSLTHQENVQGKLMRLINKNYIFRRKPDIRSLTAEEARDEKRVLFEKHRREQVFCLDKRGAQEIGIKKFDPRFRKRLANRDIPVPHHDLDVADVRACFELSARADDNMGVAVWYSDYQKDEDGEYIIRMETKNGVQVVDPDTGRERTLPLCPDGAFVLQDLQKGKQDFFYLEIDEGTEPSRSRWKKKVIAYQAFAQRGFKQQFPQFAKSGFRVLTVNRSETGKEQLKRTQGLIGATHKAKGGKRFWFCTFDTIMPEDRVSTEYVLDSPIWFRVKLDELRELAQKGHGLRLADFLFDKDLKARG